MTTGHYENTVGINANATDAPTGVGQREFRTFAFPNRISSRNNEDSAMFQLRRPDGDGVPR